MTNPKSPPPPHRGFTLIELMVVIGIIALLIGITIPTVSRVRRAAQGAATSSQLAAIAVAIQQYDGDFRAYPGPLPNTDLGGAYFNPKVSANIPEIGSTSAGKTTYAGTFDATQLQQVTGSENLVLGLLGGLEYDYTNSKIAYNPNAIFPDGITPSPKGAMGLDPTSPKRFQSYMQVKTGDISHPDPNVNGGQFADEAKRFAADTIIPEFLDKYSAPMPILYLRANVGAQGVVTYGGKDEKGTKLPAPYQYDLSGVLAYTSSAIGTNMSNQRRMFHGLQDVFPQGGAQFTDTILNDWGRRGVNNPIAVGGANALMYFKDPNTPPTDAANNPMTNANASPRQKDGFILISAGPDGIYGTEDDVIYPGSLIP